jgi:hypothetical protein
VTPLACAALVALLIGLSALATALIGRPGDSITAAFTTAGVLVGADASPNRARQPEALQERSGQDGAGRRLGEGLD